MVCRAKIPLIKSVSFKKAVEISSTQEIFTEFTHIQYIIWINSVQISWVLEISAAFLKETDFRGNIGIKYYNNRKTKPGVNSIHWRP